MYWPGYIFSKTGETVLEVLQVNHPEARLAIESSFSSYTGAPLELLLLEILEDMVKYVVRWISVRAGKGQRGQMWSDYSTGFYDMGMLVLNSGRLSLQSWSGWQTPVLPGQHTRH